MKRMVVAGLLLLPALLPAADARKDYLKIKDDTDLYVGEGLATAKEFGGDGFKALAGAKERANASLGSSIRVRISSDVEEKASSGKQGESEEISSKTKSLADVVLENVKTQDFVDFPEKGQVTVLAYVSKEDYRRQLAGKAVKVYRPENGFRIVLDNCDGQNWNKALSSNKPPAAIANKVGQGGTNMGLFSFGAEFFWSSFVVGASYGRANMPGYFYTTDDPLDSKGGNYKVWSVQTGYEWTPWALRVQPYFPLRLEMDQITLDPDPYVYNAYAFGAIGGIGLRYWPTDSFSFDISVRYHQPFNNAPLKSSGGVTVYTQADEATPVDVNTGGLDAQIGFVWSGF